MTPAKLVASLPGSIRVGPYDIALKVMTTDHRADIERHGQFCRSQILIEIEPDPPSAAHLADTLLHELNHAIYFVMNLKGDDDEERTVTGLSTGQVQVFQANPWLLKWLAKALA